MKMPPTKDAMVVRELLELSLVKLFLLLRQAKNETSANQPISN
jgi:hypothetical protein